MNTEELVSSWKAEEQIARIHGWNFSHIHGRYSEETDLPWDYRDAVLRYLRPQTRLLDIDTGGGESTDSCWRRENENEAKYAHQMNSA